MSRPLWGVWCVDSSEKDGGHWLAAHTGRTLAFPEQSTAHECADMASLRGGHYEVRKLPAVWVLAGDA